MSTETLGTSSSPHLLERVQHMYVATRSVIDALPAERFEEMLPSGWRLRDVIAHLAAWEETVPPRVESALRDGVDSGDYDPDGIAALNRRVVEDTKTAAVGDLRTRLAASHARVLEVIRSFADREVPKLATEIVEWNTTGHYPDHFADLDASIHDGEELAAVIAQGWMTFRGALAAMGMTSLDRATTSGWTYRDLVAHVAAWEERTATRLATYRASGERTYAGTTDADEFNAEVVKRTRDRSAREIVDELEAAHARLVAEVRALSSERMRAHDGWALAIVAGNTYGHYAEHHVELMAAVPGMTNELAERMRDDAKSLGRILERVGLVPLSRTTSSGWSAKAMLSHLAYWMETVPADLPKRLAGERPAVPNIDETNARTAAEADGRTAHEVVARLRQAYDGAIAAVTALGDREVPFPAARFVAVETYGHVWKHTPELEALIPRTVLDVLARFDETWTLFRAGVRDIGRARLTSNVSDEWRYTDLVAHVAAWMQQGARELESGEFARWTDGDVQRFNDRAVEAHRLVGPEAMLDELDTSQRRIRAAIAGLTDERLRDRHVAGVVAAYTYLHWEEHFTDLGVRV